MPSEATTGRARAGEWMLVAVAAAMFLGFLGSTELWGKREQRASAEAIDTVDHGRWLVAEIQSRPRLEKPPLPRWVAAGLMIATGRRDEWIVRLPNAMAALTTVGLLYLLARGSGGRTVGTSAGLALASMVFFVVEARQAGNDAPLALFTTLALWAARNRLVAEPGAWPADRPGARRWVFAFHAALGLGFLTKGPVVLALAGLPLIGYLASARRLRAGGRLLLDGWGLALLVGLALLWPVPVLLRDPTAARVWLLEMAQKTGTAGIHHGRAREILAWDWFWMTLPWTPFALIAVLRPVRRKGGGEAGSISPRFELAWWWAVGNLVMLSLWKVAKPSYYVPCLPAVAWLVGEEWVRIARRARSFGPGAASARLMIQGTWVALFVSAAVAPVVYQQANLSLPAPVVAAALGVMALVAGSAWCWRRGADAPAIGAVAAAVAAVALVGYGVVAPGENAARGHRELARALDAAVPRSVGTIRFFAELDEGLWFYLRDRELAPVEGERTRYNRGFDLLDDAAANRIEGRADRVARAREQVADWARTGDPAGSYLLIRAKVFDLFASDLADAVEPVLRESGVRRNELVLLRPRARAVAATPGSSLTR